MALDVEYGGQIGAVVDVFVLLVGGPPFGASGRDPRGRILGSLRHQIVLSGYLM